MTSSTAPDPEDVGRPCEDAAFSPKISVSPTSVFRSRQTLVLLLAACVGGGAGTFLADRYYGTIPRQEMSAKYYQESQERWATLDFSPDVVAELKLKNSTKLARNSALALGIVGTVLGGLFGLGTAIHRGSGRAMAIGIGGGALSGGVGGVLAGYAGVWMMEFFEGFQVEVAQPSDLAGAWLRKMYSAVAVHATEWGLVAIGLGLAVGWSGGQSKRQTGRTVVFSAAAALLASVLYTPLAAGIFPSLESELPFPEGAWNRLLFVMLPSLGMALMIAASPAKAKVASAAQSSR